MATPGMRNDPLPGFNFVLTLVDVSGPGGLSATGPGLAAGGGFSECSGLEGTLVLEEYIEGGENGYVHRFPSRSTWSNIVLRRGVTFSDELWNWHCAFVLGRGKRRDGIIFLQDASRTPVKAWLFRRGLPLKWTGPALNAGQSATAVEAVEIAHEGLELVSPGAAAGAASQALGSLP